MNRIYRVVWNAMKHCYVAANEKTGTAQSRGKAAAAVAATVAVMSGAAAAADAVITESGELQADKDTVVFYTHSGADGRLSYLGMNESDVSKGTDESFSLTGVAQGVDYVFVLDRKVMNVTGQNLDFTNTSLVSALGNRNTAGQILIGSNDAEKTTGSFKTLGVNWNGKGSLLSTIYIADSDTEINQLVIENAEIDVQNLHASAIWDNAHRYESTVLIEDTATVSADTLSIDAANVENRGVLSIGALETLDRDSTDNRPNKGYGRLINSGTINVTENSDPYVLLENSGTMIFAGDFALSAGQFDMTSGTLTPGTYSSNEGSVTVNGNFELAGYDVWGTGMGVPGIGILRNAGEFSVARNAVLKGALINTGSTAKFTVTGDAEVYDFVESDLAQEGLEGEYQDRYNNQIVRNEDGATFSVAGKLTVRDNGVVENAATMSAGSVEILDTGSFSNLAGGTLTADSIVWNVAENTAANAGTIKGGTIGIYADGARQGFTNAGTIDFTNGTLAVSNVVNGGTLTGGTLSLAAEKNFTQSAGLLEADTLENAGRFVVNGGTLTIGTLTGTGTVEEGDAFTAAHVSIDRLAASSVNFVKSDVPVGTIDSPAKGN